MTINHITHLNRQPFIAVLYAKAVFNSVIKTITNSGSSSAVTHQYCISGQSIDSKNLRRYMHCCGFHESNHVPATYPFVIAFPLLMKLMTSVKFPVSILGLIHYKNKIIQHQPIKPNAILSIICRVSNDNFSHRGRLIETHIEIFVEGNLAWECTSTFLHKSNKKIFSRTEKSPSNKPLAGQAMQTVASLKLSSADALKYAYISKDTNPIHMHYIPAKLMGFKTTIMHGMLAKARVLAQLETVIDIQHISIDVQFKNAIFLPSQVCLNVALSPQNNTFSLIDSDQRVTHLSGVISPST